jgi:hypothetical protein
MGLKGSRKYTAAIMAIAMFTSSAGGAASRTVDPLVALSVLGTAESHAAVCGPGTEAMGCGGGASAGSAAAAEAAATQEGTSGTTVHGSMMPLWVALCVVLIGWAWIILDDNNNDGEVNLPISP